MLPFTSERKCMSTLVLRDAPEEDGGRVMSNGTSNSGGGNVRVRLHTKGAADILLRKCKWQVGCCAVRGTQRIVPPIGQPIFLLESLQVCTPQP